ncbi:hypothetical protein [Streptomyces sp. SID9727]|uniref:hypothetical protein n=1 Tax=Streptomyces sp. SID9727 TaxID=2706114 RepID=UPI001943A934|nr:hypothetical protein [Streptomyces sp. SID9727]
MTSDNVTEGTPIEPSEAVVPVAKRDRLIDELVSRAQAEGRRTGSPTRTAGWTGNH